MNLLAIQLRIYEDVFLLINLIVMHEAEYVQAEDSHGHQTHHPAQLAHAFLHCKVQTPYILCKWLWIVIAIFHGLHVYPIIMITIH